MRINFGIYVYRSALLFLIFCNVIFAGKEGIVPYFSSLQTGAMCTVEVQTLHPTQFAVGFWEINKRAEKVKAKSDDKLEKYLQNHIGKIVIGPGGEPYIIDRHHLACIMEKTGRKSTIYATVEANFKQLPADSFWIELIKRKWAYLYDEKGKGPLDPHLLPKKISDLKNDPFRSLAWAVRERGGYAKSDDPFAEFQWAEFFRSKLTSTNADTDMERLIVEAMQLCHTPEASKLPGFLKSNEIINQDE